MARHRGLQLKTFIQAVPWDLFERYFAQLKTDSKPDPWAFINLQVMQDFLDDPQNFEARSVILEDFRRINDLCSKEADLLVRAYRYAGLILDPGWKPQESAMRLFLDNPAAFTYGWSRYLLFGTNAKISLYHLPNGPAQVSDEQLRNFEGALTEWFAAQAKGDLCQVSRFEDNSETLLFICRGSPVETIAYWQGKEIAFTSLRRVAEDVVVYDPRDGDLTIKATQAKDRLLYLRSIGKHIVDDEQLAEEATRKPGFSLVPFQDGTFDFAGNGLVTNIFLVRVRMRFLDHESSTLDLKSNDILETLQKRFAGLRLSDGHLVLVRLRLTLRPPGERPFPVLFEIAPPERTDLAQKRYANLIEDYLREQKVKCW